MNGSWILLNAIFDQIMWSCDFSLAVNTVVYKYWVSNGVSVQWHILANDIQFFSHTALFS